MIGWIIVVIIILALFYYWLINYDKKQLEKLREDYNEKEGRSKHKYERRRGERDFEKPEQITSGQDQPPRPDVLPTTKTDSVGKTGKSNGRFGKLLKRIRKK
ncbi:hypothetical protein CMI47_14130 [Candidatus Pacearchaeota archaeon]|jgi:hypothetical protein|nr:hypothetical protein [Candidatus Pacearchaeota archaeon]|tara:strand:+ start:765 stop:1070 length:306 start_codon:yes stop_codon:yes gene_type:complete